MTTTETAYTSVVEYQRPCERCDAEGAGIYERIDCGCATEVEIGDHSSKRAAIAEAKRFADKSSVKTICGVEHSPTGRWHIEKEGEYVLCSEVC